MLIQKLLLQQTVAIALNRTLEILVGMQFLLKGNCPSPLPFDVFQTPKKRYHWTVLFFLGFAIWELTRSPFCQALTLPKPSIVSQRPLPPQTGTPSGHPTPGTTRPEATCPSTDKPLTALLANNKSDFTLSEYPTFWIYIPYRAEQISNMEFLLIDSTERRTIYHAAIELKDRPGLIAISIPPQPEYALQMNTNYHWRFHLDCQPDATLEPDLALDGWVQRVPIPPQLETVQHQTYLAYQDYEIWYDAIAHLATLHFANPGDRQFNEAWANLLESLGLEWVVPEPLADSVQDDGKL